jgi:hypothetical protein
VVPSRWRKTVLVCMAAGTDEHVEDANTLIRKRQLCRNDFSRLPWRHRKNRPDIVDGKGFLFEADFNFDDVNQIETGAVALWSDRN